LFSIVILETICSLPERPREDVHDVCRRFRENSMKVIRSCIAYLVFFITTVILGLIAIAVAYITRRTDWAHLVGRLWGNVNLRCTGVKVHVEGLENIDPGRAYVYAANHQGGFDILAILGRLPVQFRWLAKEELFHVFVMGRAMKAIGYIPINRQDRRKAFESITRAAEKIRSGTSVVIFPEGTRSPDGIMRDFKKGGFILAIKSQQPIVPVSISGSHAILPNKRDWIVNPGVIHIAIGSPIPTEGCTARDRDRLIERVRQAIREHLTVKEGGLLPDREPSSS
jgi:1-acyl-sn-glycerol-3-phosphate acyltransferase